jgi:hypothetical protein
MLGAQVSVVVLFSLLVACGRQGSETGASGANDGQEIGFDRTVPGGRAL